MSESSSASRGVWMPEHARVSGTDSRPSPPSGSVEVLVRILV